ncbi:MAG TPA: SH3 domain-containing protein [Cyclobacteriaceae bacterium]|nr:SH3 domain-containing protein [Cyclobacteriaceae bacterium]
MQRLSLKFVLIISLLFISGSYTVVFAQDNLLHTADSLFTAKRYTESLEIFEAIYAEGYSSEAMLLKMAYIHEALDNSAQSLYYLNTYFLHSKDRLALQKMTELADRARLSGYDTLENDLLYGFYESNRRNISLVLLSLMIVLLAANVFTFRRKQSGQLSFLALMCIPALLLVLHINYGTNWKKGIIMQDRTVLMLGPSAAAGVMGTVPAGERFDIVNQTDVWVHINTGRGKAYVRDHAIRKVEL